MTRHMTPGQIAASVRIAEAITETLGGVDKSDILPALCAMIERTAALACVSREAIDPEMCHRIAEGISGVIVNEFREYYAKQSSRN